MLVKSNLVQPAISSLSKERMRHILESSLRLFLKRGYQKTTIREICGSCGMSMGGLYHYVGSKEEILRLLIEDLLKTWEALLKKAGSSGHPSEVLASALSGWVRLTDSFRDMFLLTYREFPAFPRTVSDRLNRVDIGTVEMFQGIIDTGGKSGVFECQHSRLLARSIKELGDIWVLKRWDFKKYCTLEQYIRAHIEMTIKSLTSCEAPTGPVTSSVTD